MNKWRIFSGSGKPHNRIQDLPEPPPWRRLEKAAENRAITYQPGEPEIEMVNAALYLRRPLLITGPPGSGKSSLIYAVAHELGLGTVLEWPINSRSTVQEGLYSYDALARLRDLQGSRKSAKNEEIGPYLRLGPLGTALATSTPQRPRALLIDEIDKGDIDLPNDLLHVLEGGRFELAELVRAADRDQGRSARVLPSDSTDPALKVAIEGGRVQAAAFPFVILTSNEERDLPPAFLRRCLCLTIDLPQEVERVERIVTAHLGKLPAGAKEKISDFVKDCKSGKKVAMDQLLNLLHLMSGNPNAEDRRNLEKRLMKELSNE